MKEDLRTSLGDKCGYFITWDLERISVPLTKIHNALELAGFETKWARKLAPVNAFIRAAAKLKKGLVIEEVVAADVPKGTARFQFTKSFLDKLSGGESEFKYSTFCFLDLDVTSGKITPVPPRLLDPDALARATEESQELAAKAQALVDSCLVNRGARDITTVVHRLFDHESANDRGVKARLFPLRQRGVCYIVTREYEEFLDKLAIFFNELSRPLTCFELNSSSKNMAGVTGAIEDGCSQMLADYEELVDKLASDSTNRMISSRRKGISDLELQLNGYKAYLGQAWEKMAKELERIREKQKQKITLLEEAAQAPAVSTTDGLVDIEEGLLDPEPDEAFANHREEPEMNLQLVDLED